MALDGVLPGDWWLQRNLVVPGNSPDDNGIELQELSKRSARLCARLSSNYLLGVHDWLVRLQSEERLDKQELGTLRDRLGYPQDKQWKDRLKLDLARWTPDFLYKVGLLRSRFDPAPQVLDWAAMLTWLTLEQGKVPGGSLPCDILIYSACAMHLSKPPHSKTEARVDHSADVQRDAWRLIMDYIEQSRPVLISQSDRQWLRLHYNETQDVLAVEAGRVSDRLRHLFQRWWNL